MPVSGAVNLTDEVISYMEVFAWAYRKSENDFKRMIDLQNMYDGVIDQNEWPTVSEIPIPVIFNMVEKALPGALEYLFPKDKFLRLTPTQMGVDIDNVRKTEFALQHYVLHRVKLQKNSVPTIKDCFKFGVGYGIIEPTVVTPPAAFTRQVSNPEGRVATRVLDLGSPMKSVRYRYVTPAQVIVTPDGTDFNGNDTPTMRFFIDMYGEDKIRQMYRDEITDGENPELSGDAEQIIKEARHKGFDSRTSVTETIARLTGKDMTKTQEDERIPVIVPILKIYEDNKHTWIANGSQVILQEENKFQTMRCPLVKASAWPEGHRWYPMSPVEASYKMGIGINVFHNAIFDLLTYILKPLAVYDKSKFPVGAPERGPDNMIGLSSGNVRDGFGYAENPQIPSQMFTINEMIQRMFGETVNQNDILSSGQTGFLRSGAFAFESLLQESTGRDRLTGAILETSFLESAIHQILVYMQLNLGEDGETIVSREFDEGSGEELIENVSITQEDIVNAYDINLNLKEKHKMNAINFSQKQADLQAGLASPFTDKYEVFMDYYGEDDRAKRLMKPKEIVQQIEEDQRQAELIAQVRGGAAEQGGVPEQTNQGEQAVAGAEAGQEV